MVVQRCETRLNHRQRKSRKCKTKRNNFALPPCNETNGNNPHNKISFLPAAKPRRWWLKLAVSMDAIVNLLQVPEGVTVTVAHWMLIGMQSSHTPICSAIFAAVLAGYIPLGHLPWHRHFHGTLTKAEYRKSEMPPDRGPTVRLLLFPTLRRLPITRALQVLSWSFEI